MPNWCENYMLIDSNGTPEGDLALQDFHNKLLEAKAYQLKFKDSFWCKSDYETLWECYLEDYIFDQSNGLFEFQGKLPVNKRGYIVSISDINFGTFHLVTEDAWAANIAFWALLIKRLYGDLISFEYQASEPGMGSYYTNMQGLLPRYNVGIDAYGITETLQVPNAWDWSNPLFPQLDRNNPYVEIPGEHRTYDYSSRWNRPSRYDFGFSFNYEGDEDDIMGEVEEYVGPTVFGKEIDFNFEDSREGCHYHTLVDEDDYKHIYSNSYGYLSIEDAIAEENFSNAIIENIVKASLKNGDDKNDET